MTNRRLKSLKQSIRDPLLAVLGRTSRGRAFIFGRMYRLNRWGDEESRSGQGSNLENAKHLCDALAPLLVRHGIRSLVDAPCGDLYWIKWADLPLDRYVGIDIVPELIEALSAAPPISRAEFRCLDVVTTAPPRADAILCRDLLVHLTYGQIGQVLANFRRSGATYLITTTFPSRPNHDVVNGRWRTVDLQAPPFSFPEPLELVQDHGGADDPAYRDKTLALWRLADLDAPVT